MDFLKKFWPMAFSTVRKEVKPFVIRLIIYWAIAAVLSLIVGITVGVVGVSAPDVANVLNLILTPITSLVGLYCTAGIVFTILRFTGVFKDEAPVVVEAEAAEASAEEPSEEN